MTRIPGKYYDGKTSKAVDAVFAADEGGSFRVVRVGDETVMAAADLPEIRISPRLANTPRSLYFPGGQKFETFDNRTVDRLLERSGKGRWAARRHRIESRTALITCLLLILLTFIWGAARYGVPWTANVISGILPQKTLAFAGTRTLAFLDKSVFSPSELDEAVKARVLTHFKPVLSAHGRLSATVMFRHGNAIGPNAFALPNGVIIFTDEMVTLSRHDDELTAVLFHELGHLVHRHGLRSVIQDSLLGFALLALTGDVSGSSELFLGIPLFLTQMAYSRGFEREADDYALRGLHQWNIPPARFADLMDRLKTLRLTKKSTQKDRRKTEIPDKEASRWTNYLSTHPKMDERLKRFRSE